MKLAHKLITDEVKQIDAPLLTRLEAAGFRLEYGEDGTGWPLKFRTRGGGYYFNVGCFRADRRRQDQADPGGRYRGAMSKTASALRDGTTRKADLLVLATGYKGPDHLLTQLFGAEVATRVGRVWGFDDATPELRIMVEPAIPIHASRSLVRHGVSQRSTLTSASERDATFAFSRRIAPELCIALSP